VHAVSFLVRMVVPCVMTISMLMATVEYLDACLAIECNC
jgi:hypothetical protein